MYLCVSQNLPKIVYFKQVQFIIDQLYLNKASKWGFFLIALVRGFLFLCNLQKPFLTFQIPDRLVDSSLEFTGIHVLFQK